MFGLFNRKNDALFAREAERLVEVARTHPGTASCTFACNVNFQMNVTYAAKEGDGTAVFDLTSHRERLTHPDKGARDLFIQNFIDAVVHAVGEPIFDIDTVIPYLRATDATDLWDDTDPIGRMVLPDAAAYLFQDLPHSLQSVSRKQLTELRISEAELFERAYTNFRRYEAEIESELLSPSVNCLTHPDESFASSLILYPDFLRKIANNHRGANLLVAVPDADCLLYESVEGANETPDIFVQAAELLMEAERPVSELIYNVSETGELTPHAAVAVEGASLNITLFECAEAA